MFTNVQNVGSGQLIRLGIGFYIPFFLLTSALYTVLGLFVGISLDAILQVFWGIAVVLTFALEYFRRSFLTPASTATRRAYVSRAKRTFRRVLDVTLFGALPVTTLVAFYAATNCFGGECVEHGQVVLYGMVAWCVIALLLLPVSLPIRHAAWLADDGAS